MVGDEGPREDGVLCDVVIIPACDLVEPLQVFVIGHVLVDPQQGLLRTDVITEGISLDLDKSLKHCQEGIGILAIEVKHHLPPVFSLDVDCVMGGVEPLLVDLAHIGEGDVEVVEGFVLKGLNAHVVKGFVPMGRAEDDVAFLIDGDEALHHCQDIDEQAFTLEWFGLYFVLFHGREANSTG